MTLKTTFLPEFDFYWGSVWKMIFHIKILLSESELYELNLKHYNWYDSALRIVICEIQF